MNDDFDLGKLVSRFIDILIRQYQFLLLLCLGATFLVFLYQTVARYTRKPVYESSVLVVTTKARSELSLGSGFKTTAEDQSKDVLSRKERLQSFSLLVDNPAVASSVFKALEPEMTRNNLGVQRLSSMVQGEIVPNSDSIRITVFYTDPVTASLIANAWGKAYVDHINAIYSRATGGLSLSEFRVKTQQAKDEYQQAQSNLDEFLRANKISEYTRQISITSAIIDDLTGAQYGLVKSMINLQEANTNQMISEVYKNQVRAQKIALSNEVANPIDVFSRTVQLDHNSRVAAIDLKKAEVVLRLSNLITESVQVASFIDNANTMLKQVKQGGQPAVSSNSLALMLLKTQVFANYDNQAIRLNQLPASFSTGLESLTVDDMVSDLQALLGVLKIRQDELNQQIQAAYTEILEADYASDLDVPLKPSGSLASLNEKRLKELAGSAFSPGISSQIDLTSTQLIQEANQQANAFLNLSGLEQALQMQSDSSPLGQEIVKLEGQVREYAALISNERSKLTELTKAKELAWDAYQALAAKEAELQISTDTTGTEVALGASAAEMGMLKDFSGSFLRSSRLIPIAFIGSLFLGILIAAAYEMWCNYHNLTPQTIFDVHRDWLRIRRYFKHAAA
jgi:capsular polysaccharide biosynthesis protein